MRNLHIVMPMGGKGLRFKNSGWSIPKPLIEANGKKLYLRAINSFNYPQAINIKYTFIVRYEHIINNHIDNDIKQNIPNANIFSVIETTRGAVETCLVAENCIEDNEAVIVLDCDLEFKSDEFHKLTLDSLATLNPQYAGVLLSFKSNQNKYSYAEVDSTNNVIRTAEKEVISDNALCGAYFFSTGYDFKRVAHKLLNEANFNKPEYYISLLYNYLIKEGKLVKLSTIDEYYSYGTPEELQQNI